MGRYVDKKDKLILLKEQDGERYYVFIPKLFKLYPRSGDMRKMTVKEILLHLSRFVNEYKLYILTDTDDLVKGSILVTRGGSVRYPFATKEDLIEGPDYTVPEFRGQGVAVRLTDAMMHEFEKDYKNIYATIKEDNHSSLRHYEKCGFDVDSRLKVDKARRFHISESGDHFLAALHKTGSGDR